MKTQRRGELLARLRVRAHGAAGGLLLGPSAGRLPGSALRDVSQWLHDATVREHVANAIELWPPTVLSYDFPDDLPPWFRRQKAVDATCVFDLRDVTVAVDSGLVTLPDGRILLESVGSLGRLTGWGSVLPDALLPVQPARFEGTAVSLPFIGYYHWLLEDLPAALATAQRVEDPRLLVSPRAPDVVRRGMARAFRPGVARRAVSPSAGRIRVPQAAFASMPEWSGFVRTEAIDLLRDSFDPRPAAHGRAIYVSRRRAHNRPLANESELEHALERRGVAIVAAEGLDLDEQIELFASAELVIAPHGAGLANLVWRTEPTTVVEIFPSTSFNDCYARLCAQLGFAYSYLVCEPHPEAAGTIPVEAVLAAAGLQELR